MLSSYNEDLTESSQCCDLLFGFVCKSGPLESNNFAVISPRKEEKHDDIFCFSNHQVISELPQLQHETEQELYYEGYESPEKTCDADHCVDRVKHGETAYG